MIPTPKNKTPLTLGVLSIALGLIIPIVGVVLGAAGLSLARKEAAKSEHDFKQETIVSIVGIVVSVLNWILGIILYL